MTSRNFSLKDLRTVKLVQGASALSPNLPLEVVWLEQNRSTNLCHLHYFAVNCEKFELGTGCNSTVVDDRSKTPYGVYPLGTSMLTPGVYIRVVTRYLNIVQQKFVSCHV